MCSLKYVVVYFRKEAVVNQRCMAGPPLPVIAACAPK